MEKMSKMLPPDTYLTFNKSAMALYAYMNKPGLLDGSFPFATVYVSEELLMPRNRDVCMAYAKTVVWNEYRYLTGELMTPQELASDISRFLLLPLVEKRPGQSAYVVPIFRADCAFDRRMYCPPWIQEPSLLSCFQGRRLGGIDATSMSLTDDVGDSQVFCRLAFHYYEPR